MPDRARGRAARASRRNKPFEGVRHQPAAALARDRVAPGCARSCRATCSSTPARPATATGSSPRRCAVKIDGRHIGEVTELSIRRRGRLVRGPAGAAHAQAAGDRGADPEGDPRAAGLPRQCRPRLPDARPRQRHAVRRREPAHPPGLADRLGPDRRALRAGRAVDRPAPARQRPAARDAQEPARPRQHGDRGRARRGRDPRGRPSDRHGPGRRACTAAWWSPRARPTR